MGTVATLIAAGGVMMLLETVLPGAIVGLVGFGCVVAGVVSAYATLETETAHWILLGVLGGLAGGSILWFRFFPSSPIARMFISRGAVGDIGTERPDLVRRSGRALTPLRPSGTALIGGERVDVVSEGGFVDRDTPLQVVAVEGLRVVVRPLPPGARASQVMPPDPVAAGPAQPESSSPIQR